MRLHPLFVKAGAAAVPIHFVSADTAAGSTGALTAYERAFMQASGFEPKPGQHLVLATPDGKLSGVLFGIEKKDDPLRNPFLPGKLSTLLPAGRYRFANPPHDPRLAVLAFALNAYQFSRYRKAKSSGVRLVIPEGVDGEEISRIAEGVALARDLINTPSNDMGPAELEAAARKLARTHGAKFRTVAGKALAKDFPLVHAVGAGSVRAPRLIDLTWGRPGDPKVTLVGKGVCFDTGGLDIKSDAGMLNMKKDMGGAATALALAHMLMAGKARVRLRVLIPAVENSISGDSFRPRDIYRARNGVTVEIGNTDAEGRLILADALALADEEKPELIIDFATLTGAARVALGPELPPFFTDDEEFASALGARAMAENDPVWRLPLWPPYEQLLDSKIADTNNVSTGGFAGAITAALFLNKFVRRARTWVHFDIFAWTPAAKPGRPEGAECQSARALYALLSDRYRVARSRERQSLSTMA
jgi:leucyl aminopeptidase